MDPKLKEGLALLFENYWILRTERPKDYFFLRGMEKSLRKEITERFGYRIYFTSDFIKLEKLPVVPQSWMGNESFTSPLDYVLFCCFLSFLEERDANSYFLLQQICEEIKDLYPSEPGINWVNRDHRRSLIRVIQFALNVSLIESIDGDLERFSHSASADVLYVSTSNSRYFMRPYPQNITEIKSYQNLLESENFDEANQVRHRVYRRLFLEPSIMEDQVSQADFYYIRNQRSSIEDYLDRNTDFHLEVYKDFAFIASEEPSSKLSMFPSQKGIDAIILHLASYLRSIKADGEIRMMISEFYEIIEILHKDYSSGWSKTFRSELSIKQLSYEILNQASSWNFIEFNATEVKILPSLALYAGSYPREFLEKDVN